MLFQLSTAIEITSTLGQRLIQNLQQSELAARAGISERALKNIERGGSGTFENIVRVVKKADHAVDNPVETSPGKLFTLSEQLRSHEESAEVIQASFRKPSVHTEVIARVNL
jgi:transcriptional regulator with XRE-family HTH domain